MNAVKETTADVIKMLSVLILKARFVGITCNSRFADIFKLTTRVISFCVFNSEPLIAIRYNKTMSSAEFILLSSQCSKGIFWCPLH